MLASGQAASRQAESEVVGSGRHQNGADSGPSLVSGISTCRPPVPVFNRIFGIFVYAAVKLLDQL